MELKLVENSITYASCHNFFYVQQKGNHILIVITNLSTNTLVKGLFMKINSKM